MRAFTITHTDPVGGTLKQVVLAHSSMAVYMWALERYGIGAITVRPGRNA